MDKIQLQPNHKRSFSSTLYLLEKKTTEIRDVLTSEKEFSMQEVKRDLSERKKQAVLQAVDEIEKEIARLAKKYQLTKHEMVESYFLNSRKSKAWEILNDSVSRRMNGFGEFPPEIAREFDADIEQLLRLVSKL